MNNRLCLIICGVAFSLAAQAGLLSRLILLSRPPPPAPAPVYNWTGWYVGVNAGASFGSAKTDFNTPDREA